ncbi:apses-domain-containing protein [Atractiella rhizophila]|nr:apses-domain-containing protein [Atractiella rhizophila]
MEQGLSSQYYEFSFHHPYPPFYPHPQMPPSAFERPALPRTKLTVLRWDRPECASIEIFQVESRNGIVVSRRADNDMVNGTKLLNVGGFTRGRRDGILKNIKDHRDVVKSGPMNLKGVYISLEKARQLAATHELLDELCMLFSLVESVFDAKSVRTVPLFETDISKYAPKFDTSSSGPPHETFMLHNPMLGQTSAVPHPTSFSNAYADALVNAGVSAPTSYHNAQYPFLCHQNQAQFAYYLPNPNPTTIPEATRSLKRSRDHDGTVSSEESFYQQPLPKRARFSASPEFGFQAPQQYAPVLSPSVSTLSSSSDQSYGVPML